MHLEKLTQLLGSPDMAARFIQMFKAQMPEQLTALQTAADQADWQSVSITDNWRIWMLMTCAKLLINWKKMLKTDKPTLLKSPLSNQKLQIS
jgi:hypothetical protein